MAKTLYDILQVSKSADVEAITASYERLRAKHADDNESLKTIKQAYDTLSDSTRREIYDRRFSAQVVSSPGGYRADIASNGVTEILSGRAIGWIVASVVVVAIFGIFLKFIPDNKRADTAAKAASDTARIEDTRTRAAVERDDERVQTERIFVERHSDSQDRRNEIYREQLERQAELARIEQQRRAAETEARIAQSNEQLRLERQRQEFVIQQRMNAEQRYVYDRDRRIAEENQAKVRDELCRAYVDNYGRRIPC